MVDWQKRETGGTDFVTRLENHLYLVGFTYIYFRTPSGRKAVVVDGVGSREGNEGAKTFAPGLGRPARFVSEQQAPKSHLKLPADIECPVTTGRCRGFR